MDDVVRQIARYDDLHELPAGPRHAGGEQSMVEVEAVDVALITPLNGANATCDRIEELVNSGDVEFEHPPMVLAWSFDGDSGSYTFVRPTRAINELPRDHGRDPTLGKWLAAGGDELRGLPKHFAPVKAARRFMNDDPPDLYTATVLWRDEPGRV